MDSDILNILKQKNVLSLFDMHFSCVLSNRFDISDADIMLAMALSRRGISLGNICLDLTEVAGTVLADTENGPVKCPAIDTWIEKLRACALVGVPGEFQPFILDAKNRFYLYRYWEYEYRLAGAIRDRLDLDMIPVDPKLLDETMTRLFPPLTDHEDVHQKLAALIPVLKPFSVISGGPGTGKTYMVARILALLIALFPEKDLKIFLAAPTGKAAAQLKESILHAKDKLNCNDRIKQLIPEETYTVHRMLGVVPGSPYFRFNENHRISADVLIVDEASMIDLPLMSKLMQSLDKDTRVILIGDKDQLSSVESGAVFGDICNHGHAIGYSPELAQKIKEIAGDIRIVSDKHQNRPSGLGDSIVILEKSYRFSNEKGIGGLSKAVKNGETDVVMDVLKTTAEAEIRWERVETADIFHSKISDDILRGYSAYLNVTDPEEALQLFSRFQLICAIRNGPFGVQGLNLLAERIFHRSGLIELNDPWYVGRPVLINRNDYDLRLFNGDMGIIMDDPESEDKLPNTFFMNPSGEPFRISPFRLPEHETAFATTVHKSQGSEYETVHLILPDRDMPLLTRELIYTGITRAKKQVTIWASESVLRSAISRKIERTSGLRDALWEA